MNDSGYIALDEVRKLKKKVFILEKKLKNFSPGENVNSTPIIEENGSYYPFQKMFVPSSEVVTDSFDQENINLYINDIIDYWLSNLITIDLELETGSKIILSTGGESNFTGVWNIEIVHIGSEGDLNYVASISSSSNSQIVQGSYNPV